MQFLLKKYICREKETIGTITTKNPSDLINLGFALSKGNSILPFNPLPLPVNCNSDPKGPSSFKHTEGPAEGFGDQLCHPLSWDWVFIFCLLLILVLWATSSLPTQIWHHPTPTSKVPSFPCCQCMLQGLQFSSTTVLSCCWGDRMCFWAHCLQAICQIIKQKQSIAALGDSKWEELLRDLGWLKMSSLDTGWDQPLPLLPSTHYSSPAFAQHREEVRKWSWTNTQQARDTKWLLSICCFWIFQWIALKARTGNPKSPHWI